MGPYFQRPENALKRAEGRLGCDDLMAFFSVRISDLEPVHNNQHNCDGVFWSCV
jgi:hypothetical protein